MYDGRAGSMHLTGMLSSLYGVDTMTLSTARAWNFIYSKQEYLFFHSAHKVIIVPCKRETQCIVYL